MMGWMISWGLLPAGLLPAGLLPPGGQTPLAVHLLTAAARQAWSVPGVAVVVVRRQQVVVLQGYGLRCLEPAAPVTPDTLFPLASCTKTFTTTLIAQLVDEGVLHWDDPVRQHLPSFRLSDQHATALLTVRDLLCHRCGWAGHDLLWYHAPWDLAETVRRAQHLPLDYPFRGGFAYSTLPFLVAGQVVERTTRRPWTELVREKLCQPLGMTGVTFSDADPLPAGTVRACGYRLDAATGRCRPLPPYPLRQPNPAGSIAATPREVARWLQFQLREGLTAEDRRLVSIQNLRETHTPHNLLRMDERAKRLNPDTVQLCYGLGWLSYDYRGLRVLAHGGMIDGFRVLLAMVPERDYGFAVLCNLHDCRLPLALVNALIDHYCGLPPKDWITYYRRLDAEDAAEQQRRQTLLQRSRDPQSRPALPLAAYAGRYDHPAYGPIQVRLTGESLQLRFSSFDSPLHHHAGEQFRVTDGFLADQLAEFVVRNGQAAAVRFLGIEFTRPPPVPSPPR